MNIRITSAVVVAFAILATAPSTRAESGEEANTDERGDLLVLGLVQEEDPSVLHVSLLIPTEFISVNPEAMDQMFNVRLTEAGAKGKVLALAIERPMKGSLEALNIPDAGTYVHVRVEVRNRVGKAARNGNPDLDPFGASVPDRFALTKPGRFDLNFYRQKGNSLMATFRFGVVDNRKGLASGFYFLQGDPGKEPKRETPDQ